MCMFMGVWFQGRGAKSTRQGDRLLQKEISADLNIPVKGNRREFFFAVSSLSFVKCFPGILILLSFGILSQDTSGEFLENKTKKQYS